MVCIVCSMCRSFQMLKINHIYNKKGQRIQALRLCLFILEAAEEEEDENATNA